MAEVNPGTGGCLCGAARDRIVRMTTQFDAHHGRIRRKFGGIELGPQVQSEAVVWESDIIVPVSVPCLRAERGLCGSSLYGSRTVEGKRRGPDARAAGTRDSFEGPERVSEHCVDAKPAGYAFAGAWTRTTETNALAMSASQGSPR
ncbi:MAG: hypothetical protein AAGB05_11605 [Pseudomonadota bacterium]